jgi:hypothetical protein
MPGMKPPIKLNGHTIVRMERLFQCSDREQAKELLLSLPCDGAEDAERLRFAALKVSDGNLTKLTEAISLGKKDFRDLLIEAHFASDFEQHQLWWPDDKVSLKPSSGDSSSSIVQCMGRLSLKRLLVGTLLIGTGLGIAIRLSDLTAEATRAAFYLVFPVPIVMIGSGASLLLFERSPFHRFFEITIIAMLLIYAILLLLVYLTLN